jgi:hypothetical protein
MKHIPNPTYVIKLPNGTEATAKDLLLLCIDYVPPQGLDLPAQRARNRVAIELEKMAPGAEIVLEDHDYVTAQDAIRMMRWNARHKDIVAHAELFGV